MRIHYALYNNDGTVSRIRPSDIASYEEYCQKYRNHLSCSEQGCPAQIEWASRMGYPYFKTWPRSKHAPECIFAFENDPSNVATRATDIIKTRISDEHKMAKLRSANRKQKEDDGLVERKPRTRSIPNPNRPTVRAEGTRRVASFDPDADPVEVGGREPNIYDRRCEEITPKDVGKPLCVRGRISGAIISEQSVRLIFDTHGHADVSAQFYHSFHDVSEQSYGWIKEIAHRIIDGSLQSLQVTCICSCEWVDSAYTLQVYDPTSIAIEGQSLASYIQRSQDE